MKIKSVIPVFLILAIIISSCKKDKTSASSFGFKANNIDHNWSYDGPASEPGAIITKKISSDGTGRNVYNLSGWNNSEGIVVNLAIYTNTLTVGVYNTTTTSSIGFFESSYLSNSVLFFPDNV